jgi:hypothetical protein
MIFVLAYTPKGYINNERQDFGSVVRFIEFNFGIPMGTLTFADARSPRNLAHFYDLSRTARKFQTVPAPLFPFGPGGAKFKLEAPDDD